jgi:hypothetical protein
MMTVVLSKTKQKAQAKARREQEEARRVQEEAEARQREEDFRRRYGDAQDADPSTSRDTQDADASTSAEAQDGVTPASADVEEPLPNDDDIKGRLTNLKSRLANAQMLDVLDSVSKELSDSQGKTTRVLTDSLCIVGLGHADQLKPAECLFVEVKEMTDSIVQKISSILWTAKRLKEEVDHHYERLDTKMKQVTPECPPLTGAEPSFLDVANRGQSSQGQASRPQVPTGQASRPQVPTGQASRPQVPTGQASRPLSGYDDQWIAPPIFKTVMCKYELNKSNGCTNGKSCTYAHSENERRRNIIAKSDYWANGP